MYNPDNWPVESGFVKEFYEDSDGGVITGDSGWSFGISAAEVENFVETVGRKPQAGDSLTVLGGIGRPITGVVIKDVILRYKTREQVEQEHKNWLAEYEQKKIDRYYENIVQWQEQVEELHPVLRARIRRFERENGPYEFWKEDGGYEMAAMNGANALLKWVDTVAGTTEDKLRYLDWWWSLNTEEHGYNYKKQMEVVPDFGEGHSGNTAGAAYAFAKAILKGEYTE